MFSKVSHLLESRLERRAARTPRVFISASLCAPHWAARQHGRALGSARRPHGISRRDGRRAQHALQGGDICDPRDRALRLPIQEADLCDRENLAQGHQVSTSPFYLSNV